MEKIIFKNFRNRLSNIEQSIDALSAKTDNDIYRTEASLFNLHKATIYRLWEFNNANNQILHQLLLQNLQKIKKFHPKVSIIIPAYNGEKYVEEAILSALNQTYDNIEIIVVNDGSTDKTETVIKKYSKKLTYYKKPNGGVSSALNYGIKRMHGNYFVWLSHDDLIAPTHVERLVEWVSYKGHQQDIPFTSFRLVDEEGCLLLDATIDAQFSCSDFKLSYTKNELSLLQGEINGGSVLIPKEAFTKCGYFDETLRISQERDMWARLIKKYHFINIPFDTAYIRTHSDQVTRTNPNITKETNIKNLEIIKNFPEERMIELFGDKIAFYENLKRFDTDNNKTFLVEEIDKLIQEIKKAKTKTKSKSSK